MKRRGPDDRLAEVLDRTITNLQENIADHAADEFRGYAVQCESPIEELFLAALTEYLVWDRSYIVGPQVEIGPYRVDFVVAYLPGHRYETRVVVECDGHDFHEKTKQQAARDKKRDRYLAAQGYTVMRFTGSELYRDPFACVEEVIDYTQNAVYERSHADYRERQAARTPVEVEVTEPDEGDA